MKLIDSHCHLETKDFGDERDAVIARAREAGLVHMIVVGSGDSIAQIENAVALAEHNADMTCAVGIHPHDVARMPDSALSLVERLAATHPRVVAVGETGLDYHYDHSPRERQREVFREFIGIARRTNKPLTLHIREGKPLGPDRGDGGDHDGDAHAHARRILVEEGILDAPTTTSVPVIVHCFTGTPEDARAWTALGAHLSFSGIVTFKTAAGLRTAAAEAPADRILVETDCPYLAPIPHRGRRNEPAWVTDTLRAIAAARGLSIEDAADLTTRNAIRAFRLPVAI